MLTIPLKGRDTATGMAVLYSRRAVKPGLE